ncbi:hypothetical protein [Halomonas smyrnensis]|uniref:hypothetical protein n=1 Tax=Halomonas smyrnensis TaxID=720605 RepID=UPI0002DA645B|nr:hypothetical protein [Halomonas smyrnensis]
MARQYRTGLIITGDASGGIKAIQATENELDQLNQGFERGGKRAKRFGQDADRAGRQLGSVTDAAGDTSRELDVLRGAAVSVGAALAGAFAVNNLAAQAQMIAETDALAQSLGASTTELQAWQYAAERVGLQGDKMGDIFKDVSDKVGDFARTGGGEAADLIEQMGLNIEELLRLSPDQQLLKIGESLQALSPSERTTFLEALGDDAVRLQSLLENNAAALREYAVEARQLGVAMGEMEIQRAVEAAESMDRLQGVAQGLANTLVADLGPGLADATQNVIEFVDAMGGADEIAEDLMVVGGSLAVLVGGRLVRAYAAHATSVFQSIAAERQMQTAAATTAQAELLAAQNAQRRAAAERYAAKRMLGRAQAEERATRGTDAHTAALERLNQRRRAAVAASAKHRTAITTTTVAQQRYTASARVAARVTRGLSGALALVGGPLGLLVGAGGLLYMFRDELGLTQQRIGLTEDELESFREELDEMSGQDLGQSLASLNASLEEATLKAAAAREEVAKLRAEDDGYSVTGVGNLSDQVAGINALAEAQEKLRGIEQQRNESRIELWGRWSDVVVNGTAATDANSDANDHNTETIASQTEAGEEAAKALERQQEAAQSLLDELFPLEKQQREYREGVDTLTAALMRGEISQQRYEAALKRHENSYRSNQTAAEAYGLEVDNLADRADPMADAFQQASNRIDETFADAFQGAFDSFGDFASQLEDAFKRLLAELAYQATLRPIVVGITGQMQGALGIGGQGGGMFGGLTGGGGLGGSGSLLSMGRNLWSSAQQGFGNIAWTGASNTAYAGGWAGSATGGMGQSGLWGGSTSNFSGMTGLASAGAGMLGSYAGSQLGGAITDKQANSSWGATAGGAIGTYFGGPIGAFAGSTIGGVLDSLFGSGGSDLDLAMVRAGQNTYGDSGRWDKGIRARGGLGVVGFDEDGTKELADLWDIDEAQQLIDSIAQLDSMLASLATSEAELADMRRVAQGHYGETSHPDQVADRLTSRYGRVLDQLGGDFGRFVRGLGGTIDEMVPQALAARQAFTFVSDSAETLNLRFRTTGASAYEAAASLAEMAGGMEGLQSLQANYTSAMYSDQERMVRLEAELRTEFRALGMTLPETREGFRDLVEAQNLNTRAGRQNYTQLLRMVDGFNQLQQTMGDTEDGVDSLEDSLATAQGNAADAEQAVRRAWEAFDNQSSAQRIDLLELMGDQERILALQREDELASLDASLRPIQERIWALQDEAQAQAAAAEAGQQYASALADAGEWLGGMLGNISEWVDQQQATAQSPAVNLDNAQQQFARQLAMAEAGDREALQSITQYADRYLAAGEAYYASGTGAQRIEGEILDALAALPEATSAEQFIVDGVRDALESSLAELPGGIAGAVSPLFDTIDLNADELIDYGEFERLFGGLASDEQLAQIFEQLDANGDGTITALEAVERTTGGVEGNTKSLEERAADQVERLNRLVGEMTSTTDQFVTLNSTMSSLRESINALGVAQEEAARIERESKASELRTQAGVEKDRLRAVREESLDRRDNLQSRVDSLAATQKSASSYDRYVDQAMFDTAVNNPSWERRMWDSDYDYYYQVVNGRRQKVWRDDWDEIFNAASDYRDRREELSELRRQLSNLEGNIPGIESDRLDALRADYESLMGEPAPFAKGGAFTNSIVNQPTLFDMGLMGEAGPEAIMPLHRGPGGSLGIRAELPAPPVPSLPLLGQGDVVEAVNDLRREVAALREENARLLREGNQHAAAGVRVSQAGHQRSITQLERLADSNERINDRQRLETAR